MEVANERGCLPGMSRGSFAGVISLRNSIIFNLVEKNVDERNIYPVDGGYGLMGAAPHPLTRSKIVFLLMI